ncbi:hypothetical protein [Microbaculum marinum]|uniref:Uncharacterized protein n=1 Tax=Microbaculum marinum TaxID=1764581 RepID=A0AAW9RPC8_9HYPH
MTIKIYNNEKDYSIYPVITTGTSDSDLWLRSWFGIKNKDSDDAIDSGKPFFPKNNNYRIYINPEGKGIPPRGSVTVTLPLFTQLVANPTQKADDEFMDWWGGSHIEIFAAPAADGKPPPELAAFYKKKDKQTEVDLKSLPKDAVLPTCKDCQPLKFFRDTSGVFKNNAPYQLAEFTLGAINHNVDPPGFGSFYGAVDIDVSYVDTAFLPAVMAPINDEETSDLNHVGYVGTPMRIDTFRNKLAKFLKAYPGWPQFLSEDKPREPILKIASPLHAFAGDTDLTDPKSWAIFPVLRKQWEDCTTSGSKTYNQTICTQMRTVRDLFQANYDNYVKIFPNTKGCHKDLGPAKLTSDLMIAQVYAFGPFTQNCDNFADKNRIELTPGYTDDNKVGNAKFAAAKKAFDDLNYWKDGSFNPYVLFIHNKPYLNAPNTYAYSVDDAVGNLQADGNGFVLAVGGTRGLPNPNPASPPVNVNFGSGNMFGEFTHFGVCTTKKKDINRVVNPDYRSIPVYVQEDNLSKCPISLLAKWAPGGEEVVYSFKLKTLDFTYNFNPKKAIDTKTHAPIDCDGLDPIPQRLCCDIYAYAERSIGKGPEARYAVLPALYPHDGPQKCPDIPPPSKVKKKKKKNR